MILGLGVLPAHGFDREPQTIVDDLRLSALKQARPVVRKEGFQLRETDWDGVVFPGKPINIKLQGYRGNEYVVWISADLKMLGNQALNISVLDQKNQLIPSQSSQSGGVTALRFSPESSGTFQIRMEIAAKESQSVMVALIYAYK